MLKYTARLSHYFSYMFRLTWTIIREHNGVCRINRTPQRCQPHTHKRTTLCAAYTELHNGE